MKEIIESKLKELEDLYDYWLEESDNPEREYIDDKLYTIRYQINILKEVLEIYNSKILKGDSDDLQKKAELGDHYKHLYSEVKKQKDDVAEYIKYQLSNLDLEKDEDVKAKMLGSMILVMLEDNGMLGEIDE